MKLLRRIYYLLNRKRLERDLQDEMASHRAEMPRGGQTSFGRTLRLREESRDAWGWLWLDQLQQDFVYAVRQLRRSPVFALTAIGILAVGIGANLGMVQVLDAAVFHWLSVKDADSLVQFEPGFSFATIDFYRDRSDVFSYVVAERNEESVFLEDRTKPEPATFVSARYFADLEVKPAQGRLLDQADSGPSAPPVVVLGYVFWQRRMGGDPSVVGRVLRLNGKPVQVAGVTPADFEGLFKGPGGPPALWFPVSVHPYLFTGSKTLTDLAQRDAAMYAKLKPGVSMAGAEAQLASLTLDLRRQYPDLNQFRDAPRGEPLLALPQDALVPLALVTFLVLLVLLTACANLGNILLARGQSRAHEIEIRAAVGAGSLRIVRQLVTENLLLAILGCTAGSGVGFFAAKSLLKVVNASPGVHLVVGWRLVITGVALVFFSVVAFGLAPALQAVRRAARITRARRVLVAVQVGASCFLLIVASLLTRSAQRSLAIDVRFDYRNMLVLDPRLQSHAVNGPAARQTLDLMAARLEQVPGVVGVTTALFAPFNGRPGVADFRPGTPRINYNQVAPSYFALMNLPTVGGRVFSADESGVVILSESTARAIWPQEDPLGKTLSVAGFNLEGGSADGKMIKNMAGSRQQRTVIGVVKDSGAGRTGNTLEGYVPISDANVSKASLIVRAAGDPAALLPDLRSAAAVPGVRPEAWLMRTSAEQAVGAPPGVLLSLGSLSATATMLAAVGIFGLVAFAVAQRTREIGVRMALGARPRDIVKTLLSQYTLAMSVGAGAGVLLATMMGQVLASRIIGFRAGDPASYLIALAIFAAVALTAILIPARRALRIDPASALRWE